MRTAHTNALALLLQTGPNNKPKLPCKIEECGEM